MWLVDRSGGAIGDGRYDLAIQVVSSEARIQAVFCEVCSTTKEAAAGLEDLSSPMRQQLWAVDRYPWTATSEPLFDGRVIAVRVPMTVCTSGAGRIVKEAQHEGLLVCVRYSDGKYVGKVVGIPRSRAARSVRVAFP